MPRELEFYLNNGGKYSFIPTPRELGKSIYITTPNKYYDSLRGQRVIEDFLDNMVLGEHLGFDGLFVLEQHSGPNAVAGQAIVIATMLAARTSRIRIGAVGALINGYLTPMRYAEEVATLDIVSNGRYFFGLPMGIGSNYHAYAMANPTYARERHAEAHDFLIKALTEPGPFEWDGQFFRAPYVNLWPKPLQRPHPPVWIPAAGSRESLEVAAKHRYTYLAILVPKPVLLQNCNTFRELCLQNGYEADPRQIAATMMVHVAETDRQARLESEAHFMSMFQNSFASVFHDAFPPGHVTERSLRGMMAGGYRSSDPAATTWETAVANNQIVAGSPATVIERIEQITSEMGAGRVVVTGDAWTMPSWLTRKNMTMFAEEVMPYFRGNHGKPVWDRSDDEPGAQTISEYAARVEPPLQRPRAYVEGTGMIDIRTSHVEELRTALEP